MYCIVMYQEKTYQIGFEQKTCISAVFHSLFYIQAHVKRAPEVIVQKKNLCGSIKGEIKLWWPDKTIIVHVNLLESVFSAVAAIGLCHLLQTDQSILVQIKAEEVFHRSLLDQIVGEESTVSLGDRFMQWSLSSSSVWAEFAEFTPAISFPDQIGYCSFTIATKKVTSTATQPTHHETQLGSNRTLTSLGGEKEAKAGATSLHWLLHSTDHQSLPTPVFIGLFDFINL